jgi:hypothetical protein
MTRARHDLLVIWIRILLICGVLVLGMCVKARADDTICFDFSVAQPMLLELQQCRITDRISDEQQAEIDTLKQLVQGKDQIIKIKDDIIAAKDMQIRTLQAAEIVKSLEDVVSVQGSVIEKLRPSSATGIARFGLVILSILTFGLIH